MTRASEPQFVEESHRGVLVHAPKTQRPEFPNRRQSEERRVSAIR